ncbi:MAG: RNA polymerase sigma factor, partial [Acidimicrobiales bacterium]
RPGAWLLVAARRRALDRLRREARGEAKLALLRAAERAGGEPDPPVDAGRLRDDQLALIFGCCHPALAVEAQVALTLRAVCGLTTGEVARAFLVPEATMAQRLVRAKRKIRAAGLRFTPPGGEQLAARLDAVLAVVYLVFNEGYAATAGDELIRHELCEEAIRLARLVASLAPDEPEALGLLALLLLTDARRAARTSPNGELVPLDEQDRSRWDRSKVEEGLRALAAAAGGERVGPYQLQAGIAALHDQAARAEDVDWRRVAGLYHALHRLAPSPVVALNRAVAVGMAWGSDAGLALLDELAPALSERHLFHAARADLLRRAGRRAEARTAFLVARALAPTSQEQRSIDRRLAELSEP